MNKGDGVTGKLAQDGVCMCVFCVYTCKCLYIRVSVSTVAIDRSGSFVSLFQAVLSVRVHPTRGCFESLSYVTGYTGL